MALAQIATAVSLAGAIAGGAYFLDDRHTSKADFVELAGSYQNFVRESRLGLYRRRLWALQKKFGPDCGPVKDECDALKIEISAILRSLSPRR